MTAIELIQDAELIDEILVNLLLTRRCNFECLQL